MRRETQRLLVLSPRRRPVSGRWQVRSPPFTGNPLNCRGSGWGERSACRCTVRGVSRRSAREGEGQPARHRTSPAPLAREARPWSTSAGEEGSRASFFPLVNAPAAFLGVRLILPNVASGPQSLPSLGPSRSVVVVPERFTRWRNRGHFIFLTLPFSWHPDIGSDKVVWALPGRRGSADGELGPVHRKVLGSVLGPGAHTEAAGWIPVGAPVGGSRLMCFSLCLSTFLSLSNVNRKHF